MTLRRPPVNAELQRRKTPRTLLARLIDAPDLVSTVRALPAPMFSALVRQIGVADAGEIVALATTDQLVAAFDEDLFFNAKPGERETFDGTRFAVWLEVLLEAGDAAAASRVAELSEDFAVQALSSLVLVLDYDAFLTRLFRAGDAAFAVDKAIESALSEELDGYLLISRRHDGWDAALALILALDRDHRPLLVRILDRCAEIASPYIDDLEELTTVLSAAESLAEDVEAEREDRLGKRGYVEPRAARSFLALARQPFTAEATSAERDPVTRAYFRGLEQPAAAARHEAADETRGDSPTLRGLLRALETVGGAPPTALLSTGGDAPSAGGSAALMEALRLLGDRDPPVFDERMEELAYLANVLVAGAATQRKRFRPADAAEAALATVALGAELEAGAIAAAGRRARATPRELCEVLRSARADALFRKASSVLAERNLVQVTNAFLCSNAELDAALDRLRDQRD